LAAALSQFGRGRHDGCPPRRHCTAPPATVIPEGANPRRDARVYSPTCRYEIAHVTNPTRPPGLLLDPHPGGLMVVLYLFARLLLGGFHLLVRWGARRLEKRYVRFAAAADALLAGAAKRGGTNRPDPFVNAKLQYDLALVAKKRDRVEER